MKTLIKKIASWNEMWDKQSLAFVWAAIGFMAGILTMRIITEACRLLVG